MALWTQSVAGVYPQDHYTPPGIAQPPKASDWILMTSVGIYRVRTTLTGVSGLPGLHTAYFAEPTSGNPTSAAAVAARVRGAWDVFKTTMAVGISIQVQAGVDFLDPTTAGLLGSYPITPPAVVTSTGSGIAAPQVQGGVVLDTSIVVNGRRLRGHMFLGPLSTSSVSGATPPAGLNSNLDAFGVALIGASPPLSNPLVVWHRPSAPGVPDGSDSPVLSAQHATKYFTLRSRLN